MLLNFLMVTLVGLTAQVPEPAPEQRQAMVLAGAVLHLGNGQLLEAGFLRFDKGRITHVGLADPSQPGDRRIEASGQHAYPGFILLNSPLGLSEVESIKATHDFQETGSLNPNVSALSSYNTDSEMIPTLRFNGILLAQVTPSGGLISGRSSLVQLDAWNWEDAVVLADEGMHLNWPSRYKREFNFSEMRVLWEENKDYGKQVAELEDLFRAAAQSQQAGAAVVNLKLAAVAGLLAGEMRLYLHADQAQEILNALNFAESMGVRHPVLVGGAQAEAVASHLLARGVAVIVDEVHQLPAHPDAPLDSGYDLAVRLHRLGVRVALSYASPRSGRNLPFTAGSLVAYGMSPEDALATITSTPAHILGISDRLGSLEVGKDATLFLSAGDALDMRTNRLSHAFIQGREIVLDGRQQQLFERYRKRYAK
jgi:imidazolonepropionase-like amidohydrolase